MGAACAVPTDDIAKPIAMTRPPTPQNNLGIYVLLCGKRSEANPAAGGLQRIQFWWQHRLLAPHAL